MNFFKWLFGQPYLLLTITTLCWGGNAIAGKIAVGNISPFLLTNLRWTAALIILMPFALPHLKRDWEKIKLKLLFLFLLGAIGFAVFNNLMYLSLNHTTAINVAIVQASMPLIVFVLNFFLFSIRASSKQLLGFFITLIGVVTVTATGDFQKLMTLTFNYGDILMLVAIMSYGVYSVFLKNKPDIHWLSFIGVLALSAFVTSIPFSIYEAQNQTIILPNLTGWLVVLYTAIFPSLVAQVFWIRGLELIGSNAGGVFINLVPIIGTAFAIIILGEQLHLYHIAAMALVLGGIWLAQQKRKL